MTPIISRQIIKPVKFLVPAIAIAIAPQEKVNNDSQ